MRKEGYYERHLHPHERPQIRGQTRGKRENREAAAGRFCRAVGGQPAALGILCRDEAETIEALAKTSPYAVSAAKAPVVLVIAARKDVIFPGITDIDCAIATENLWLELEELGLGGVMMAVSPVPDRIEKVGKILNLPDNQYAFALLPFGYPVGKKPQVDRYDAKKIHWVE